jgi:hypothetical protein
MLPKPHDIVDRDEDWEILSRFTGELPPGLHGAAIAALTGRRRAGKSFLLEQFSSLNGGLYYEARQEESLEQAQTRFRDTIAAYDPARAPDVLSLPVCAPDSWDRLVEIAINRTFARKANGRIPPVIIDEFPYLLRDTPHFQSILHQLYDTQHYRPGEVRPPWAMKGWFNRLIEGRLLLCGSAMSVMHELGHGSRPLFGRLSWTMTMDPFDHIDMAQFWGIEDRRVAFLLYAVLGGAPGYKLPLLTVANLPAPQTVEEFDAWISEALLRPRPDFFTDTEIGHLLREDPRAGDKAIYRDAMRAIADGATTLAKVGGVIGKTKEEIDPVVARLVSMRYVEERVDFLRPRGEALRLTDPIIRFHHAVVRSRMSELGRGTTTPAAAWKAARHSFRSQVLGPAFEEAAFYSAFPPLRARDVDVSMHGWTLVNDPATRTAHEVDFVGLAFESYPRPKGAHITVVGETKATERARGLKDLERLRHIRSLLAKDHDAADAKLMIFSMHGFSEHLRSAAKEAPDEILLFDLDDMYSWKQPAR